MLEKSDWEELEKMMNDASGKVDEDPDNFAEMLLSFLDDVENEGHVSHDPGERWKTCRGCRLALALIIRIMGEEVIDRVDVEDFRMGFAILQDKHTGIETPCIVCEALGDRFIIPISPPQLLSKENDTTEMISATLIKWINLVQEVNSLRAELDQLRGEV